MSQTTEVFDNKGTADYIPFVMHANTNYIILSVYTVSYILCCT